MINSIAYKGLVLNRPAHTIPIQFLPIIDVWLEVIPIYLMYKNIPMKV